MFRQCGVDRIATTRADAEQTQALLVDERKRRQEVHGTSYVLDAGGRILQVAGFAAALALV